MSLTALVASFVLFALMEFGDKTHIAVITLSMRRRAVDVFIGAMVAFALVDGASVAFGGVVARVLPIFWIRVVSGALFLFFGVLTLFREEREREVDIEEKNAALSAFGTVTLMELGDKTQFASFVLAARYGSPLSVFLGIILASAVITGSGIVIGRGLMKIVPERYLRYITSALFIAFGLIFLINAFLDIELF